MNIVESLQEKKNFSPNEKLLVDYILEHGEDVIHMSIRELSQNAYIATSTIIKLCKKLHLSGFKEFKIELSRNLEIEYKRISAINANMPFDHNDAMIVVAKKIAQLSKDTIDFTSQLLSDQLLKNAVNMIMKADKIYAFGVSDSFLKISEFHLKMLRIGKYVHLVHSQPDQVFLATHATSKDVAILVSYSGTTAEIENVAKILKKRKIPMILITSNCECFAAKAAKTVIPLPNQEDVKTNISNFSSQFAIFYVLNVIYACIFKMNYDESITIREMGKKSYLHF